MLPNEALKRYFNFDSFKKNQLEIIGSILKGNNVLAVLPTGAGKSLCYQIPALISKNFSIVISPLLSLMKNQVDSLNKIEEVAAVINSSIDYKEFEIIIQKLALGKIKILLVSPERLESSDFVSRIKNLSPEYLFIDEAHCISEWGHNFRPSYRKIKNFAEFISIKNISAFTATATKEVRNDIVKQLNFKKPEVFVKGFERENLELNIIETNKKNKAALSLINQFEQPAIIYTNTRKLAEEISNYLNLHKVDCRYYHAGLANEIRIKTQEDFQNDEISIIAATNAFGMGIDKKNIRTIIHYNAPSSIENYYQEIGRAGRDGKPAKVFLLFDNSDMNIHNYFLLNANPDKLLIQNVYEAICNYSNVEIGNVNKDEILIDYAYINSFTKRKLNKGLLYSTLKTLEKSGYLKIVTNYKDKASIEMVFDPPSLKEFIKKTKIKNFKNILLYLLRVYGSKVFNSKLQLQFYLITKEINLNEDAINKTFEKLDDLGILIYRRKLKGDNVTLTTPRVSTDRLQIDYRKINTMFLLGQKKIDKMVGFAQTNNCRFKYILDYFGENNEKYRCGKCDNCKKDMLLEDSSVNYIREKIITVFKEYQYQIKEELLISILKGNAQRMNYTKYDSYSSCMNFSDKEIKYVLDNLLKECLIDKSTGKIATLSLTKLGEEFEITTENKILETPEIKFNDALELYAQLKIIRQIIAKKFLQSEYIVCPNHILKTIADNKPTNENEIFEIPGFTRRMFNKIGNDLIEAINEFESKKLSNNEKHLPQNLTATMKLFEEGYSLSAIANLRKLSQTTISMHIESIIELFPNIEIDKVVDNKFVKLINIELDNGAKGLKELKENLPNYISYPMIRIVKAKWNSVSSLSVLNK